VSIRPYREADREAIRALTTEGFVGVAVEHAIEQRWPETSPLTWDQRKLLDVEADLDRHPETCFVAEEGDQVVVYVTATISVAKSQGHIRDLVVGAPLRGRGVGRRLLQRAIAEFRRRGVRIARIETLGHNRIGAHFYPRLGFELVATQNHYAMVLSDHDDAE
jgi:ribosomal protein S18 acetylase RimI-like enzyme